MPGLLQRARRYLFSGFDAIEHKNRRKPAQALLRSADGDANDTERDKLTWSGRDITRNFTIARWMCQRHLDYVTTFTFQAKTPNQELKKKIEARIAWHSKRENCDVGARHSLPRAIRLAELRRTVDGDMLPIRMADGRVQWLEGDRIRVGQGDLPSGIDRTKLVRGVLTGDGGQALAYAISRRGRDSLGSTGSSFQFERMVPARNAYLHGYFDRFDQVRGFSPMNSALNEMRDTYEGFDLARARMKIAQMFGLIFYRDKISDEDEGARTEKDEDGNYVVDFGRGPIKLDLDAGDRAEFLESKSPSIEFQSFSQTMIATALKALDIPYSFFAENFTNYSGQRQALLQYERSALVKQQDNVDLLDWLTEWWLTLDMIDGELPWFDPNEMGWEWIPTGMPWIDPLKEVLALKEEIALGINTRTRALRRRGLIFEDIAAELAHEAQVLADLGLPLNINTDNALITMLMKDDAQPQQAA